MPSSITIEHTSDKPVNNKRTLIVGASFPGQFHLIKKIQKLNKVRFVFILTRPPEQYEEEEYFVTNKIGEVNDFEGTIVVFTEMLDSK